MDKEKQIEEMALALSEGSCGKECNCIQCDKFNCHLLYSASVLHNAGYRKASEVAREIFEEIEKIRAKELHRCEILRKRESDLSERKYWEGGEHSLRQLTYWFNELKKKYTEDGE